MRGYNKYWFWVSFKCFCASCISVNSAGPCAWPLGKQHKLILQFLGMNFFTKLFYFLNFMDMNKKWLKLAPTPRLLTFIVFTSKKYFILYVYLGAIKLQINNFDWYDRFFSNDALKVYEILFFQKFWYRFCCYFRCKKLYWINTILLYSRLVLFGAFITCLKEFFEIKIT